MDIPSSLNERLFLFLKQEGFEGQHNEALWAWLGEHLEKDETSFLITPASVSGERVEGEELTGTPSVWEGEDSLTYSHRWLRDGVVISGQTTTTYTLSPEDGGHVVQYRSGVTNSTGGLLQFASPAGPPVIGE